MDLIRARGAMVSLGYDHTDRPTKSEVKASIERMRSTELWKYMESEMESFLTYLETHDVPRIGFVGE